MLTIPDQIPIMVLADTLLFPHALVPIHIFESSYRKMLAHALETDRVFAIAMLKPKVKEIKTRKDFFQVAGLGLVRACIANPDGTSNLVLQGIGRVRIKEIIQEKPFWISRAQELPTRGATKSATVEALGQKVIELCREFQDRGVELPPPLDTHLAELEDTDMLADLVAAQHYFVRSSLARQQLLQITNLAERLRFLIQCLYRELDKGHVDN